MNNLNERIEWLREAILTAEKEADGLVEFTEQWRANQRLLSNYYSLLDWFEANL